MNRNNSSLSQRGQKLSNNPARIDFELFLEASENLYDPKKNPDGYFVMNIAENDLMGGVIQNQLNRIIKSEEMPEWVLKYTQLTGHPDVRERVARFMENHLCKCPIHADSLGFSAGASAIVEVSSFVLANPGDLVVIPAPSYPMYSNDFGIKSGMERFDLQTYYELAEVQDMAPISIDLLNKTYASIEDSGKCFKILLITSPDNPTGAVYTIEQLEDIAKWCHSKQIHLIVNEIYGLSKIDTNHLEISDDYSFYGSYQSFAQIMHKLKSDYLHLWYALSKDFAMSGLRFGIVHSLNTDFITGFGNVNVPHMVSNISQWLVSKLLDDEHFLKNYLIENQKQLTKSYVLVISYLKKLGIPYVPSRGSFFIWADLSKYLDPKEGNAEHQLWLNIFYKAGILLTPGMGFEHQKKGMFRIVFTSLSYSELEVAMSRLDNYLVGLN